MEKAKAQVREKVGGMIQQLSAIHEEDHEGLEGWMVRWTMKNASRCFKRSMFWRFTVLSLGFA